MATKQKAQRSVKLGECDGHPVLTITEVKGVREPRTVRSHYRVERNTNAPRAWRLHKLTHIDEEPQVYDIDLAGGTCDCRGHEAHGHCKHVEALLALEAAGKLAIN